MLAIALAAHDAGPPAVLRRPRPPRRQGPRFKACLAPLHRTKWFVYSKRPVRRAGAGAWPICPATPTGSRSPTAASSPPTPTGVTFSYKDYRIEGPGRYKTMDAQAERVHQAIPDARPA